MYTYEFTDRALKQIKKLPRDIQNRIIDKLDHYIATENPLAFADHLVNYEIGQYRYRIGDYRVIFDMEDTLLVSLTLDHRREIYR